MNFNYCPNCSKPELSKETTTKYVCSNCGHEFWNNPKATVAVIMIKDGQILFSKRAIEPNKGKYDFPGGFVEYNESPYDACLREIKEETGLVIDKTKLQLFALYNAEYIPGVSVVDSMFVIEHSTGEPKPADDSCALEFKDFDFIDNKDFVSYYPGLLSKLKDYLKEN